MAKDRSFLKFADAHGGVGNVITPNSLSRHAGTRTEQRTLPLGTGAVTSGNYNVAVTPLAGRVTRVRILGSAAVTGTALTAMVRVYDPTGATPTNLFTVAADIKFATAAAARVGVIATLVSPVPIHAAGQLVEVVITATAITAGPGDLTVAVNWFPSEDVKETNGRYYTKGSDILS